MELPDSPLWCWWGVVTAVREDDTARGATFNRKRDWPLVYLERPYALSAQGPRLTPYEADKAMLRRAVSRIRGDAVPFLPLLDWPGPVVLFGFAAVACWTGQLEGGWYQADGQGDRETSIQNASWVAQSVTEGARVAGSYLRRCASTFPSAAAAKVESAAGHYEQIAGLLQPALVGDPGERYQDFIGDMERQRKYGRDLCKGLMAKLTAAADEMEEALTLAE